MTPPLKSLPIIRERHRSKRLVFYSHKGGVGKTTLTTNLSYALGLRDKRVLLVDSDPQCNLSAYMLDSEALDRLLDESDKPAGRTIWSTLKWSTTSGLEQIAIPALDRPHNIQLLPGDIRLSEFEEELSHLWTDAQLRRSRGFVAVTALSLIVNSLAHAFDADFVFYDCGPNIGPLNRSILLDCDYFIVPVACDEFSVRAVRTLGYSIKRWMDQWSDIADLAPDGTYLLPGQPKFLGYVSQQFKVYGGDITSGFQQFVSRIDKHVRADVVGVVGAASSKGPYEFGAIQNLSSLVSASQRAGQPVWAVAEGSPELKITAKEAFDKMAQKVIRLSSDKVKSHA